MLNCPCLEALCIFREMVVSWFREVEAGDAEDNLGIKAVGLGNREVS